MAEQNLFGQVPIGGITPQMQQADLSFLDAERKLRLQRDIFERQKFVQDRSVRLDAAERVAGFDVSELHNDFLLNFKYQVDQFQDSFDKGELTPEQLAIEANRLTAEYNQLTGWYSEQRKLYSDAYSDPNQLAAANQTLPAGSMYTVTQSLAEKDDQAGRLFVPGTYDPNTNKGKVVFAGGGSEMMTVSEAMARQAKLGDVKDASGVAFTGVGPYMFDRTDVDLGSLKATAVSQPVVNQIAVLDKNNKWNKENAEQVFDANFTADKVFRGQVRQHIEEVLGITLTDAEKEMFDNSPFEILSDKNMVLVAAVTKAKDFFITESEFNIKPTSSGGGGGKGKTPDEFKVYGDVSISRVGEGGRRYAATMPLSIPNIEVGEGAPISAQEVIKIGSDYFIRGKQGTTPVIIPMEYKTEEELGEVAGRLGDLFADVDLEVMNYSDTFRTNFLKKTSETLYGGLKSPERIQFEIAELMSGANQREKDRRLAEQASQLFPPTE